MSRSKISEKAKESRHDAQIKSFTKNLNRRRRGMVLEYRSNYSLKLSEN